MVRRIRSREQHILEIRRLQKSCRIIAAFQRLEMGLAASDLCRLAIAEIVCKQAPFSLDNEVEALSTVVFDQNRPIRVV